MPVIGKAATLAQGQTPILITWDYNALAGRDTLNGNPPVDVVVPKTGVVAGVYVQAISAFAPHPNAAKLWMEYLYSDEGQLGWLKGYCHPIRFNDLAKNGKIPADVLAKLPPAESYAAAVFPSLDEQGKAKEAITKQLGRRRRRQRPVSLRSQPGGRCGRPASRSTVVRRMTRHQLLTNRAAADARRAPPEAARSLRLPTQWLGVAPFFIFAMMFLILPTLYLDASARFRTRTAQFTLDNIAALAQPSHRRRLLDFDQGQRRLGHPRRLARACHCHRHRARRPAELDSLRDADLLRRRLELCRRAAGLRLPRHALGGSGSSPCSSTPCSASTSTLPASTSCRFWGLTLTYLYFQIPLMVVIITPAIDGIEEGNGARRPPRSAPPSAQYWRMVVIPVLWPSFLGTVILLFRQRLRRHRHGLCADRLLAQHRAHPALCADPRRRAAQRRISATPSPSA